MFISILIYIMDYRLLKDVIGLLEHFHEENDDATGATAIDSFKLWLFNKMHGQKLEQPEPEWEGKQQGRSVESVISTLFVHLNRYAKMYAKSAIEDSMFSTQEEFIYLINLEAYGPMGKMELIKRNIQEKPVGMQIIQRLLAHGWVEQRASTTDKRSKIIAITEEGLRALNVQMPQIRRATQIVTGNLQYEEKIELIRLLTKLDQFHKPIFQANNNRSDLLNMVFDEHLTLKN